MADSLSIILPVHNAQGELAAMVEAVLDIAGELRCPFDVLIADDGSTDHTEEVACELATHYHQVHVVRNADRRGIGRTARAALQHAAGDFVIARQTGGDFNVDAIARLWRARNEPGAVSSAAGGLCLLRRREEDSADSHLARIRRYHQRPPEEAEQTPAESQQRHAGEKDGKPRRPWYKYVQRIKAFALGE